MDTSSVIESLDQNNQLLNELTLKLDEHRELTIKALDHLAKILSTFEESFDKDPSRHSVEEIEEYIEAARFCQQVISRRYHRIVEAQQYLEEM